MMSLSTLSTIKFLFTYFFNFTDKLLNILIFKYLKVSESRIQIGVLHPIHATPPPTYFVFLNCPFLLQLPLFSYLNVLEYFKFILYIQILYRYCSLIINITKYANWLQTFLARHCTY